MTKQDLEKIGVIYLGDKLNPNNFFIPQVGEANLYEPYSLDDVYKKIFDSGYENGVKIGESKKVNEIKKVLNIEQL